MFKKHKLTYQLVKKIILLYWQKLKKKKIFTKSFKNDDDFKIF